jgi:antitoxin VapB
MALNIKSEKADRLARELAERTGETLTQAVVIALEERLERHRPSFDDDDRVDDVLAIARRFARLPVLDARDINDIVEYSEYGVPR